MFAYISKNKISFLSAEKLDKDFLTDAEKYQVVEYDNAITEPIYNEQTQKIEQKKHEETREEKFRRVYQKLLELPELNATTDTAILEGVEFNDEQIGDLILHRVFGGNPHAESAMQAKVLGMLLKGEQNAGLLREVAEKQAKINEIRVFFGLKAI